jgi:hypothetical protein
MPSKSKDSRIKAEMKRLREIYGDLTPKKAALAAGLIERAAFMRVECEDLEADLRERGWTEPFQQSDKVEPYDRARPQGQAYQTLNANYQKIVKQLDAMLPPEESAARPKDDGFEDFISGRDGP